MTRGAPRGGRDGGAARRRRLLGRIVILGAVLLLAALHPRLAALPAADALEGRLLGWRHALAGARPVTAPVLVVAIDEASLAAHGGWPVPRARLAEAVDRLAAAGASAIAIDLLMTAPARDPAGDARLAAAIAGAGRVVLPVAMIPSAEGRTAALPPLAARTVTLSRPPEAAPPPRAEALLAPIPLFAEAAAGIGHVNLLLDAAGTVRGLHPAIAFAGDDDGGADRALASLVIEAARVAAGLPPGRVAVRLPEAVTLGPRRIALGADGTWTLRFAGPGGEVARVSLADLLAGRVSPGQIAGRIVWLGATATSVGDSVVTPFAADLPGVVALAEASAALAEDGFLARGPGALLGESGAVLAIALAGLAAARAAHPAAALALALLPALGWSVVAVLAFARADLWLNMAIPLLTAALVAGPALLARLLRAEAGQRRLAHYVPRPLAGFVDRRGPAGDAPREIAVLFVDLAGFTGRVEALAPERTAALMRRLHDEIERAALAEGGYVDSFAGDGGMIVFGLPEADPPRDARAALAAARALVARMAALGLPVRVGLHAGPVSLARLGDRARQQLTMAGDTVNVASRLMEVARDEGAAIAVSAALVDRLARPPTDFARHPRRALRGRRGTLDVWIGPHPGATPASSPADQPAGGLADPPSMPRRNG